MAENLVIVESPAKAKTIKKYLGKDFEVLASYGHVRDLIPKEGAVDPDKHFKMSYQSIERNEKHVDAIARALKKSKNLFLATDPDREGEAISWHLRELLEERGELKGKEVKRVVFYEITKGEVQRAVAEPRDLSLDLVNAQQARRALDYLVGFNLSPLLWKKVRRGLSAGRVQSPALRMICEREHEISIFKPQEYWTLEADGEHSAQNFPLKLIEFNGTKVEQFSFTNEGSARDVEQSIKDAAQGFLHVVSIDKKQRRRNPSPPFTTSTLQQEAARKLGYSAQRTMRLAQQLYEGVDFGEGSIGLITYMRTDSVNLAVDAVNEMREVIAREYGKEAVAEEPRVYKTKSRNAQEAHEAIRPTSAAILPSKLEGKIDPDQFKLYSLVWKRAMASQMSHALFDTVAVDMVPSTQSDGKGTESGATAGRHVLRANGSTLVKPGYMAVYQEDVDDSKPENENDRILPAMNDGDVVTLLNVHGDQHFTEPPPRFSEASLVKALEEHGIGRPSTYATIISTLKDREYVDMDNRRFIPTDIGKIVGGFLSKHFHKYVEYGFTAALEDELDAVSRGEENWTEPLKKFWKPFITQVDHIEKNVSREEVAQARELGKDPVSGKPVTVRMGRYGPFVQIGTKDDEEKPKFAGLRPGQKMDLIKLPEALELFKLPVNLGVTADGEPVQSNIGRFGPYIKYGAKYVSLKPPDDPYTVTLERALEVIAAKKEADANRIIQDFGVDNIQVLNGRYGPYITDGKRNARIPKDSDPKAVTLDLCRELLAKAPLRGSRFGRKKNANTKAPAKDAAARDAAAAGAEAGAPKKAARKTAAKNAKKSDAADNAAGSDAAKPAKKAAASKKSPRASDAKTSATAPKKSAAKSRKKESKA
ncbi:MAG: topoisomerase [Steroidobacteraceae bacterium]|jgi:DNA topoisomerase-1|nr:topoisomerase [Steroidobacteraceae bacterium]